jgi:hypothetical protein
LTRLSTDGAPEAACRRLRGVFSEVEVANLTVLIGPIHLWNRRAVGAASTLPRRCDHDDDVLTPEGVTRGPAMLEWVVSLARQSLDRILSPR